MIIFINFLLFAQTQQIQNSTPPQSFFKQHTKKLVLTGLIVIGILAATYCFKAYIPTSSYSTTDKKKSQNNTLSGNPSSNESQTFELTLGITLWNSTDLNLKNMSITSNDEEEKKWLAAFVDYSKGNISNFVRLLFDNKYEISEMQHTGELYLNKFGTDFSDCNQNFIKLLENHKLIGINYTRLMFAKNPYLSRLKLPIKMLVRKENNTFELKDLPKQNLPQQNLPQQNLPQFNTI